MFQHADFDDMIVFFIEIYKKFRHLNIQVSTKTKDMSEFLEIQYAPPFLQIIFRTFIKDQKRTKITVTCWNHLHKIMNK